jgi:nucleoside-diphosphate-sugar epimerase
MKKIFITGGGGYVGTRLVPILLKKKYKVTVYDTFYFGNYLRKNKNLKIIKADIRNTEFLKKKCKGHEYFLHLACVSND